MGRLLALFLQCTTCTHCLQSLQERKRYYAQKSLEKKKNAWADFSEKENNLGSLKNKILIYQHEFI